MSCDAAKPEIIKRLFSSAPVLTKPFIMKCKHIKELNVLADKMDRKNGLKKKEWKRYQKLSHRFKKAFTKAINY